MDVILDTILMLAILIFVGYGLKKAKLFEEDSLPTLNNLIVYIGLPCLIFTSIYSEDFSLIAKVGIMPILLVVPALITGLLSYIILKAVKCDSKKNVEPDCFHNDYKQRFNGFSNMFGGLWK